MKLNKERGIIYIRNSKKKLRKQCVVHFKDAKLTTAQSQQESNKTKARQTDSPVNSPQLPYSTSVWIFLLVFGGEVASLGGDTKRQLVSFFCHLRLDVNQL